MEELVALREAQLANAFEVERYNRQALETTDWIHDKELMLPEDLGRDISSVEALKRAHDAFERDVEAIANKENALRQEADSLKVRHADEANHLDTVQSSVSSRLAKLRESSRQRKVWPSH
jgi:hypothetical protein